MTAYRLFTIATGTPRTEMSRPSTVHAVNATVLAKARSKTSRKNAVRTPLPCQRCFR
jgi:hypothetical protein